MAQSLGDAVLELRTDDTALDRGIDRARGAGEKLGRDFKRIAADISASFERMGQRLQNVGRRLSIAVTAPLLGAAGLMARAADAQIQAEARLAAAIRASGDEVDPQLALFKEYAAAIQRVTTVGDEATLANIQVARSMGLNAAQSASAAKNAVALASAFGINERSAIRYTAALEQGDTTMLNRYIPTLRQFEDQNARVAEAQRILADAFTVAEESARQGLGPLRQLSNAAGDLAEQFGALILEAVNPFILRAKSLVESLQSMSAETRTTILVVGGIAAAIGPGLLALGLLIRGLGFALAGITAFASGIRILLLGTLMRFASGLTLVVGALYGLSRLFPQTFAGLREELGETLSSLRSEIEGLAGGLDVVPGAIRETAAELEALGSQLSGATAGFTDLAAAAETAREAMQLTEGTRTPAEAMQAEMDKINSLLDQGAIGIDTWTRAHEQTSQRFGNTWAQVGMSVAGSMRQIGQAFGDESKTMATIAKVAGIAQATISMFTGAAKALELPWPANLAAMAAVLAQGASIIASIKSTAVPAFAEGGRFRVGGVGGIDSQLVQFWATPGEMVDVRTPGQAAAASAPASTTIIQAPGMRMGRGLFMTDAELDWLMEQIGERARQGTRIEVRRNR